MIVKLLSSLANPVHKKNANDKNEVVRHYGIYRRIPFSCGFFDRNSHRAAASASRHRSPAGSAWTRLFLGRGLLVSRREALQMARRILDPCAVRRRLLGGAALRRWTLL